MLIADSPKAKVVKTENYNFIFNKETGLFARWGRTQSDNPDYSPYGPEIADIEISKSCSRGCSFCYKSNTKSGQNMSFKTFKKIFATFPKTLTQIAFGIGDLNANKDLKKIFRYTRKNGVIPNVTINGRQLDKNWVKFLSSTCGAVAVSYYEDNECFNAVKKLTDAGLKQVNIHCLVAKETLSNCFELINKSKSDSRLKALNAIVFLLLKPVGDRNKYTQVTALADYKKLIEYAFNNKIRVGFDSCSASSFLKAIKDRKDYAQLETFVEPCESTLFSIYINVEGKTFPCSFSEKHSDYKGISLLKKDIDFIKEVWYNEETLKFRKTNINCNGCRKCILYNLEMK